MFEYLKTADSEQAQAGIYFALRRLAYGRSAGTEQFDVGPTEPPGPAESLGRRILREIQQAEGTPLALMDESKAAKYQKELASVARELTKTESPARHVDAEAVLSKWQRTSDEVLSDIRTAVHIVPLISVSGIYGLTALLALTVILILAACVVVLPSKTPAGVWSDEVSLLGRVWTLAPANRLFLLAALMGALGASLSVMREFVWYVGNRRLSRRWLPSFVLRPFLGASLGVMLVLLLVAGNLTDPTQVQSAYYNVGAYAGIVGLFSMQVAYKLEEVAAALFKPSSPPRKE